MKVVVPIAGRGSRFQKVADKNPEYKKPKPFINVKGHPMVFWATSSLPFIQPRDLIFIALKEHEKNHQISKTLKKYYGPDVTIVFIPDVTRGAAETALQAKKYINNDEALIITDSDHFLDGQAIFEGIKLDPKIDGLIPVFEATDPKWSFSRLDKNGFVDLVAEKKPISTHANIGAYYFGSGKMFVENAEEMIRNNELTNNEFFIAPVYNKLISKGKKIKLVFPKYAYGLGTPDDLEYFLANTHYSL